MKKQTVLVVLAATLFIPPATLTASKVTDRSIESAEDCNTLKKKSALVDFQFLRIHNTLNNPPPLIGTYKEVQQEQQLRLKYGLTDRFQLGINSAHKTRPPSSDDRYRFHFVGKYRLGDENKTLAFTPYFNYDFLSMEGIDSLAPENLGLVLGKTIRFLNLRLEYQVNFFDMIGGADEGANTALPPSRRRKAPPLPSYFSYHLRPALTITFSKNFMFSGELDYAYDAEDEADNGWRFKFGVERVDILRKPTGKIYIAGLDYNFSL